MISGTALALLREWYRGAYALGLIIILLGLAVLAGGHPSAGTVFPLGLSSWLFSFLGLMLFSVYFYYHVKWVGEAVGHRRDTEEEALFYRLSRTFLFFLLMSLITFILVRLNLWWVGLVVWLLLLFYPFAIVLDDVSELDNLMSTVDVWRKAPYALLEYLTASFVLLLTAFFLEVALGWVGYVLSVLIVCLFVLPFSVTLLSLSYLLRYPLTKRSLGLK